MYYHLLSYYAKYGDIDKLKEVYKKYKVKDEDMEQCFRFACVNNQLDIAKQIIEWCPKLDWGKDNERIFRWVCQEGHLDIAKQLVKWHPDLDQGICHELSFRSACMFGHLDVVRWLLSNRPNLDQGICNEEGFLKACREGHTNLVRQLVEWRPKKLISLVLSNTHLKKGEKIDILRPHMAQLRIKYWILWCLYNPNLKVGRRYIQRFFINCILYREVFK